MMYEQKAIESISVLILIILIAASLRKAGFFKYEHSGFFARIIINITLPALIFGALSSSNLEPEGLLLAVSMIISILITAIVAWLLCALLRLDRSKKGAVILGAAFPSSAFLGYAFVKQLYPGNSNAIADAAIISELGVALMLFTFGIFVAMYFGSAEVSRKKLYREVLKFLYSPVFISLLLGLAFSFFKISTEGALMDGLYNLLHIISSANTFLVAMTIGIMLKFDHLRKFTGIILMTILLKLGLQPFLQYIQSDLYAFSELWKRISVLEGAMPTAALTAVFARQYGEDQGLVSGLVFVSFITSCITLVVWVILMIS